MRHRERNPKGLAKGWPKPQDRADMCDSHYGILAHLRQPLPADFEATVRDAAGHGPEILGALMLIARDDPDPLAQLGATKALALSTQPRAAEALRRVCGLPVEFRHPAVRAVFGWSRERIAAECGPRLLGHRPPPRDDGRAWKEFSEWTASEALSADYTTVREEPWEEAEFAEGYYKEMDDLTLQFGDPDWEV